MKLFDGEKISIETFPLYVKISDEEINEKYSSGELRVVTEQARYPLSTVAELFKNKDKYNDLQDYQRGYVWNDEKRSKLIESFIINIPIPPIFLYEYKYSKYEILDGKQRISAIVDFYDDKYALTGLEEWNCLNGRVYSKLPEKIKEGLDRRYLSSMILLNESTSNGRNVDELIRMVFERLNTGGVSLSAQESRNALLGGKFNDMCKRLAENEVFNKSWNFKSKKYYNQYNLFGEKIENEYNYYSSLIDNSEIILRFFAYRQLPENDYDLNLTKYLDLYLKSANCFSEMLIAKLEQLYIDTLNFAYELFEGKPFRIRATGIPTLLIYDPLMQVLSNLLEYKDKIIDNKRVICNEIYKLFKDKRNVFNGKITHKAMIRERIAILMEFFGNYYEK